MQVNAPRDGRQLEDLLPLSSDGRRIGRAVERLGLLLELAGIGLQTIGSELRWRRLRAMRRWGS
jgi:hypothetical protein